MPSKSEKYIYKGPPNPIKAILQKWESPSSAADKINRVRDHIPARARLADTTGAHVRRSGRTDCIRRIQSPERSKLSGPEQNRALGLTREGARPLELSLLKE